MELILLMIKTLVGVLLASVGIIIALFPIHVINSWVGSDTIKHIMEFIISIVGWISIWASIAVFILAHILGIILLF